MRTTNPELHRKRKLQIVEAASKCFVQRGFHQTSMKEICREASMSPGNLYRYFKSKEDIIKAAADAETEWLAEEMQKIGETENIVDALTTTAMITIEEFNDPDQARFIAEIYAEAARNPSVGSCFSRNDAEMRRAIARLVQTAEREGKISPLLKPDETAQALAALIDGFSTRILVEPDFKPAKARKTIRQMIKSLLRPV